MNCYSLKKYIFILFLSTLFYVSTVRASDHLPAILDFYPNCSYQVIDNFVVKVKTENPFADKTRLTLLTKLRRKAKSLDADNILLIDKKVIKVKNTETYYGLDSAKVSKFVVSYTAELISTCESESHISQKATPYNHQGHQVKKGKVTSITIQTKIVFSPPQKAKLNHPVINNTELSLVNGLYGIEMGSSYQHVIDTFGDPSIVLSEFEDELTLGYGRKHWLHFQANKLVKVESQLPSLSATLLNKIPLRDFFDNVPWTIANQLVRHSTLADVKSVLAVEADLNEKKQLLLKGPKSLLTLSFSYRRHTENNVKEYFLDGFSLQANDYTKPSHQVPHRRDGQFDTLALALPQLKQEKEASWKSLKTELGQPLGRITLSSNSYVDVYNSNLLIEIKSSELATIQLLEPLFNSRHTNEKSLPWFLGEFVQNKSLEQLRGYFPADSFELDNRVEIDTEVYQLTLFFDDSEDENTLYEAEMSFY